MSKFQPMITVLFALFFITLPFLKAIAAPQSSQVLTLESGMEFILKENHSSPMVASIIFVRSGSKYESQYENGITHFLEHLLFNGTINLSGEELDKSISDRGGYINAFTRKELTAYMVLLPKQYIEYGLTVQADMLFNSLIPDEVLPKERKIVIEEINRSNDSPGAAAESFFMEKAYDGTPYLSPVLGYKSFIENIPRDAIVNYYKQNYTPGKMTALIIGDFDTGEMRQTIDKIFGAIRIQQPDSLFVQEDDYDEPVPIMERKTYQQRFDTVGNVTSTYINFSFEAPHISDSDYFAFDILTSYLDMEEVSPLIKVLKSGPVQLATEMGVSLIPYREFSRLEVSVITDEPDQVDRIIANVLEQLGKVSVHQADENSLQGIKTTNRCEEIYNSEKLHYYGFMIAPYMMVGGFDFIQNLSDNLDKVSWSDCQRAAAKWLEAPSYTVTVVKPAADSELAYSPVSLSTEELTAYFDTTEFSTYELASAPMLEYPATDSVVLELADPAEYHVETLANGMTVIVKSSADSRVFAMNVLGKGRSINEPDRLAGITDFVNRTLEKGTLTRSAAELSRDLAQIGAKVTLYDNPWIPYDDRYTQRAYSFLKFETIDDYALRGFNLFSEMLSDPAFDSAEVEKVRKSMLGIMARNEISPGKVAGDLFYETLFDAGPYSKPIMGSKATISTITVADLKEHHARFYAPENIIISIVTSRTIAEIMEWVDHRFGRLTSGGYDYQLAKEPTPVLTTKKAHKELEKEQIHIYIGGRLPAVASQDHAAIAIASRILSGRLYLTLREKQGLAYSVGAGTGYDVDFGWYYAMIGTGSENYEKAVDGIILQIEKLKLDGPTLAEINRARNRIWGRLMSSKLSRINQAYYLALNNYHGLSIRYDQEYLAELGAVTPELIRRVCSKYYKTDAFVFVTAGKTTAD